MSFHSLEWKTSDVELPCTIQKIRCWAPFPARKVSDVIVLHSICTDKPSPILSLCSKQQPAAPRANLPRYKTASPQGPGREPAWENTWEIGLEIEKCSHTLVQTRFCAVFQLCVSCSDLPTGWFVFTAPFLWWAWDVLCLCQHADAEHQPWLQVFLSISSLKWKIEHSIV